jgi:hypothetical protein
MNHLTLLNYLQSCLQIGTELSFWAISQLFLKKAKWYCFRSAEAQPADTHSSSSPNWSRTPNSTTPNHQDPPQLPTQKLNQKVQRLNRQTLTKHLPKLVKNPSPAPNQNLSPKKHARKIPNTTSAEDVRSSWEKVIPATYVGAGCIFRVGSI